MSAPIDEPTRLMIKRGLFKIKNRTEYSHGLGWMTMYGDVLAGLYNHPEEWAHVPQRAYQGHIANVTEAISTLLLWLIDWELNKYR